MRARLFLVASLLMLATTVSASGQVIRAGGALPAGSAPGGITVVGRAVVRVRPDVVRFTARFNLRPASMDGLLSQIDAVTQGFVKAGVDANTMSHDLGPIYAPQMQNQGIELTVSGSAHPAPAAQLAAIYQKVMTSLNPINGVTFQNFSASFALQDCSAAEEQARAGAIADAHRRAQAIARDENVSLGALLGASETIIAPLSCNNVQQNVQNGTLDMSAQPMVSVTMQLTVTYGIRI